MQKDAAQTLYSASDLCHFAECQYLTVLDAQHLLTPMVKTPDAQEAELIQRKGYEHEARYLQKLRDQGLSIVNIHDHAKGNRARAEATLKAMREGHDIVYQATFLEGNLVGHADFLRRTPVPSALGNYSYEVMDTKLSRTSKAKFLVQLVFYSRLLAGLQQRDPINMVVVLGDMKEAVYRYADYRHFVEHLLQRYTAFLDDEAARKQVYPLPCQKCDQCHWRDRCKQKWEDDDHLCRVANITSGQILKLNGAGISTMAQLASLSTRKRIPKLQAATLNNLVMQASLQTEFKKTGVMRWQPKPVPAGEKKGFGRLPLPDVGDLYFDMEGNPLIPGGLEYLFGVWFREDGEEKFKGFWAHSRAEEKRAFEAFMDFVTAHLVRHPGAHVYHYAAYEETALKKLMSLHATRENQVDALLKNGKLVDLYKVVKEGMWVSEPKYSIKNIEHFYLPARAGDVQNAGASIVFYERWMEEGDAALLKKIEDYNRDDVISTCRLHEWLIANRASGLLWCAPPQSKESKRKPAQAELSEPADGMSEAERRLASYRSQLMDPLPQDERTWTLEQQLSALVFYFLDFHRRTMKPVWWALFNRNEQDTESWIEDPECIGGLQVVSHESIAKQGRSKARERYVCSFPEQDFKLKGPGSALLFPGMHGVNIFQFDREARQITIDVKGDDAVALPAKFAVGAQDTVSNQKLVEALFRYADTFLEQCSTITEMYTPEGLRPRYAALTDFLLRRLPVVRGLKAGDALHQSGDGVDRILDLALKLDSSVLTIQGPPGAGKTYTGSHLIVGLVKAGKTLGISSNSHKAIHNLLDGVVKVAQAQGVALAGVKKTTDTNPDSEYDGPLFANASSNAEALLTLAPLGSSPIAVQIVAGTAWLFADAAADQAFDYLFVDEAGQVSVANLVAMGTSAKNIILLGDQMQLSQPVQGVHPGDSGLSSLDYLLRGQATIAPEAGVFLETTFRMCPDVCQFISEAVYDGRLLPDVRTRGQRLVLDKTAHAALAATGVQHVPVFHEGCSQRSDEEVRLVRELLESLLQQHYVDHTGNTHPMTLNDVLVVAPYNVQVNALKDALPEHARVGTVDKFQGQEAEVVIVSMTTSSQEDLPRFMDFLFSKNRLNVAISRARCLALFIANPKLMEIDCSTPEQMALVNTVCWVGRLS